MTVFRVTLTTKNGQTGFPNWVNFECHYCDLHDLTFSLNEGRIVEGTVLRTKRSEEPGIFNIIGRKPYALGRPGVASIEMPDAVFVETEGGS